MSDSELVLRADDDGVATLTLNRPERLNAIDHGLAARLVAHLRAIAETPEIGVVILTGAGRGFCAGGEIAELSLAEDVSAEAEAATTRGEMESVVLLREMPQIVIAAINGPCAGAGLGLATLSDLRYAAASAVFNSAFLDVGCSSDYAVSLGLSRTVGMPKAAELLLSPGRFTVEQALAWGLVHAVLPDAELLDHARAVARRICGFSRLAVANTKANLEDAARLDLRALLDVEARRVTACQYGPEAAAATRRVLR